MNLSLRSTSLGRMLPIYVKKCRFRFCPKTFKSSKFWYDIVSHNFLTFDTICKIPVKAQGAKFDGGYSMFDLPEADPPEADLLASGELDVQCLQPAAGGFDVQSFQRSDQTAFHTSESRC